MGFVCPLPWFRIDLRRKSSVCMVRASSAEEKSVEKALKVLNVSPRGKLRYGSSWRSMLGRLEELKVTGTRLERLMERFPELLELNPTDTLQPFLRTVTTVLDYDEKAASILFCKRPSLLLHPEIAMAEILALLLNTGCDEKQLRYLVLRFPGIIELNPERVREHLSFLCKYIGFQVREISPLIRRSPWILCYDVEREMRPVVDFLDEVGVENIKLIVQTEPKIAPVYDFLYRLGLSERDIPLVLQLFPMLLIASIEEKLAPNAEFLYELGIARSEVARIVRAFPQVLVLDSETQMSKVVDFFRQKNVRDVGYLVSCLPPLLSYEVDAEIRPKMMFLERLGLTVKDIVHFPGYFSFPLYDLIVPRMAFLRSLGVTIGATRLSKALACTDEQFCERVALVPVQQYYMFCDALTKRRMGLGPGEDISVTKPRRAQGARKKYRRRKKERVFPTRCRFPIRDIL